MGTQREHGIAIGIALLVVLGGLVGPVGAAVIDSDPSATAPSENCAFPVERTDATGTAVTVPAEPETVVTLNPSAAQTMWEIGERENVIGVSEYATYLDGAENLTTVGAWSVNVETVVSLDPDLVLAPNTIPNETVEKLRNSGLTVYKFEMATSLASVVEKTRLTGELVGACATADRGADEMADTLATLREGVDDETAPRVLYHMGGGYTAGEGTFIDSIIEAAGGTNVAARAGIEGYAKISEEVVLQQDPQWIFTNSDIGSVPTSSGYSETTALEKNQTPVVNANNVSQPAPRAVHPVKTLAELMHPAAYHRSVPGGVSFEVALDSGEVLWRGQSVLMADTAADRSTLSLRPVVDGQTESSVETLAFDDEPVRVVNTTDFETGEYAVTKNDSVVAFTDGRVANDSVSTRDAGSFRVFDQTLEGEFVGKEGQPVSSITKPTGDEVGIRFGSNRSRYDLVVSSEVADLSPSSLRAVFAAPNELDATTRDVGGDTAGEFVLTGVTDSWYPVDLGELQTNPYTFEFAVTNTTASDDASITIRDETDDDDADPEPEVSRDVVHVARGGVAEIPLAFPAGVSSGTLTVTDRSTGNYRARLEVTDGGDGRATVTLNTYLAGHDAPRAENEFARVASTADPSDAVSVGSVDAAGGNGALPVGEYELAISSNTTGHQSGGSDDVGTLSIDHRRITALETASITPDGDDSIENRSELHAMFDAGTITNTHSFDATETAVIEIGATGLEGVIRAHTNVSSGSGFADLLADRNGTDPLSLVARPADPAEGRTHSPVDIGAGARSVVYDRSNSTYYVLVQVSNLTTGTGSGGAYDLTFALSDPRIPAKNTERRASARIWVDGIHLGFDRASVRDHEVLTVQPAANQTITGETDLPPGTPLVVRISGVNGSTFDTREAIRVGSNGTFATSFDFSHRRINESFDVTVTSPQLEEWHATAAGLVVRPDTSTQPPTTSDRNSTVSLTDQGNGSATTKPAETPTVSSPTTDTRTSRTRTPGFGVFIVCVAVLAVSIRSISRD